MIELSGLNYLAIALAWLVNCGVGAYWYSPAGFAKQCAKHTGVDIMKLPQKQATNILGFVVLSGLVQAFALGVVLRSLNITTAANGLVAGLVLWAGFTAATTVGTTLYAKKNWNFWWLNSSYFLIVMAVNSIILAVWR